MSDLTSGPTLDPQQEAAFRQAVAEGLADIEAGRTIPYETVRAWLLSWGADEESMPPQCG